MSFEAIRNLHHICQVEGCTSVGMLVLVHGKSICTVREFSINLCAKGFISIKYT
jgi:hypothetical protein